MYSSQGELPENSQLAAKITRLAVSNVVFKDIILHEGRPMKINAPGGLKVAEKIKDPVTNEVVMDEKYVPTKNDLAQLLTLLDPQWEAKMSSRAIDQGRSFGGKDRLRLNFYLEGMEGIAGVIRRFPAKPPSMKTLKAPDAMRDMLTRRSGLILVVGQASAGKSTTCAAMLDEIAHTWATHIVTVENPIEFKHEDARATFSQRQVGSKGLISTAAGVEDAMRQSPGVIYVAEIKDMDTANAVFYALESGHLVIATSHARSPVDGLQRLLSFFPKDRMAKCASLASNLIGVIHQALVPTVEASRGQDKDYEPERTGFQAFFEVLPAIDPVCIALMNDKLSDLQINLQLHEEGKSPVDLKGVQTLNSSLAEAIRRRTVLLVDAMAAATDPKGLSKRVS